MKIKELKNIIITIFLTIVIVLGIFELYNLFRITNLFIIANIFLFISHYIIDPIFHELGHAIFGKICKWEVKKIYVLNMKIYENGKVTFKKESTGLKNIFGLTKMYQPNINCKYVLPLLGGIIGNMFQMLIFIIIYYLANNVYIKAITMPCAISAIISIITNMIPMYNKLMPTDTQQIINRWKSYKDGTIEEAIQVGKILTEIECSNIENISDDEFMLDKPITNQYIYALRYMYSIKLEGKKKIKQLEKLLKYDFPCIGRNVVLTEIILYKMIYDCKKKEINKLYNDNEYQKYLENENDTFNVMLVKYSYLKVNGKEKEANEILNKINEDISETKIENLKLSKTNFLNEVCKNIK